MPILNLNDKECYDLSQLLKMVEWSITHNFKIINTEFMIQRLQNWQRAFYVPTKNKRNWKEIMERYFEEKYGI